MHSRLVPLAAMAASLAFAQTQPAAEFEVASIKPNPAGDNRVSIQITPGGRWVATNVTAKMLIQRAYNVKDFQISGAPGWLGSERFDITAKAEGASTPDQIRPMLQSLLADRLQLKFHRESKEMPIYALVVAKGGPKLQANSGGPGPQIRMGRGLLSGQKMTVAMLANQIANQVGRTVIDKTGLTGEYDLKLEWTPELGQGAGPPGGRPEGASPPPNTSGPSIFTAIQEQLGLKLESQKGPVEILVIEKVERPTEN